MYNCRLHFTPSMDYDSPQALFNGALLDMSSDDINDTDPIIDIIPEPISNSLTLGFVPIVTAPSSTNSTTEHFSQLVPTVHSVIHPTHPSDSSSSSSNTDPSTPSAAKSEADYEPHHKQLQTLKVSFSM